MEHVVHEQFTCKLLMPKCFTRIMLCNIIVQSTSHSHAEDQVGLMSSIKVDSASNCTMLSNCVMTRCLPGWACIVSGDISINNIHYFEHNSTCVAVYRRNLVMQGWKYMDTFDHIASQTTYSTIAPCTSTHQWRTSPPSTNQSMTIT